MREDLLAPAPGRPLWLMTLADLALLLVGFLVLVQATTDPRALARGLRDGFDGPVAAAPMPLAASAATFSRGSAVVGEPAPLIAWAHDALADPRATVTVTGSADASEGGVLLAADRARAVLAVLATAGLPGERLTIATARGPARATLTLALAGDPARSVR